MKRIIQVQVARGSKFYFAECFDLPLVTQGEDARWACEERERSRRYTVGRRERRRLWFGAGRLHPLQLRDRFRALSLATLCYRVNVLDFSLQRREVRGCRSVELRALCNEVPRTPPGPEGSNGIGIASGAADHPKFLALKRNSQPAVWRSTPWSRR